MAVGWLLVYPHREAKKMNPGYQEILILLALLGVLVGFITLIVLLAKKFF
ncbi:hypothetical protein WG915_07830 [Corynebacterium sp. H128]